METDIDKHFKKCEAGTTENNSKIFAFSNLNTKEMFEPMFAETRPKAEPERSG
jgi:hypothetical protein